MATITAATGGGAWGTGASWVGGVAPISTDDVVLPTTLTSPITIGSGVSVACRTCTVNANGTATTLTTAATSTLTVGDGATYIANAFDVVRTSGTTVPGVSHRGTLALKGGARLGNCPFELLAGFVIEFDRSCAHGTAISWQIGSNNTQTNSGVRSRTASTGAMSKTARGTIRSSAAGSNANGRFTNGGFVASSMAALVGVDIADVGTSTLPIFPFSPTGTAAAVLSLQECTADRCGTFTTGSVVCGVATVVSVLNCTSRNCLAGQSTFLLDLREGAVKTTGTREIIGLRSDRAVQLSATGFTLGNWVMRTGARPLSVITGATFEDVYNMIWWTEDGTTVTLPAHQLGSDPTRAYRRMYALASGISNERWVNVGTAATGSTATGRFRQIAYQSIDGDQVGDMFCWAGGNPTAVHTIDIQQCLGLPNGADKTKQSGKLTSPLGNLSNTRWTVDHNTLYCATLVASAQTGTETGVQVGETQTAGMGTIFDSIQSNLLIGTAAGTAVALCRIGSVNQADVVAAANCGHNGFLNPTAGRNSGGVAGYYGNGTSVPLVASGTLGVGDVTADPQIADSRKRDLALYYQDTAGTTTGTVAGDVAAAFVEMMKANDPAGSYNVAWDIDTVLDWVLDGYRPTNNAMRGAAHDGTDIGAVAMSALPAPTIELSSTSMGFTATAGGSNPAAKTRTIANTGTGTLSGLAVGSITYDAGATGWIASATLDVTTAPATLTVTATTGALTAGTYTAHVPVTSSASGVTNSPQTLDVSFVIAAPASSITSVAVAPTTASIVVGSTQQLTPTVVGTGSYSSAVTYFTSDAAVATVNSAGLVTAVGAGTCTATCRSVQDITKLATCATTVTVPAPRIGVATTDPAWLTPYSIAGTAPVIRSVTNAGDSTLDGLSVSVVYATGEVSGWLAASLAGATAPTSLTLTPNTSAGGPGGTGLPPRIYHATVSIQSSGTAPTVSFAVTLQVSPTGVTSVARAMATARRVDDSVITLRPVAYTVDRNDLIACDPSNASCTAIASVGVPTTVTMTAAAGGQSATSTFTVYPDGYFG